MFVAFNSTFLPLFVLGMEGMPRRVSFYEPKFHTLNVWVSISAFVLGISMLIFLFNAVYSLIFVRAKAESNPWRSKSLEWQVPTPVPVNNFEQIPVFDSDPYDYGTPLVVGGPAGRRRRRVRAMSTPSEETPPRDDGARRCRPGWRSRPSRRTWAHARCRSPRGCWRERRPSSSLPSCSPTSTCAR